MSQPERGGDARLLRFPRVSGDEPKSATACTADWMFSPRERG